MFSITDVVSGGYCVGCGACATVSPDISMRVTAMATFEPDLAKASAESLDVAGKVCPFSDQSPNETEAGTRLFSVDSDKFDPLIGYYNILGAGGVADKAARETSSSGGLTNWILLRLMQRGLVDGIIHVGTDDTCSSDERLFGYSVSTSAEQVISKKKSKYYATQMSDVLHFIKGDGRRYAFVGVPCFVSAARHIAEIDPTYRRQVLFFIGLVCGHLKSARFPELMAWQLGVPPTDLAEVDFRLKRAGGPASHYHFAARSKTTGKWNSAVASSLYGGDWGHAFFQPKACDYCDDIFAEAADVALGDAWIPRYDQDWLGTNVVVSRNREIDAIVAEGQKDGSIEWDALSESDLVRSQAGNFRHRRDALSLRLADAIARGEKVPHKRIAPGSVKLSMLRKRIIRLREKTATMSHIAFAEARSAGDLSLFMVRMKPLTASVATTYRMMKLTTVSGVIGVARGVIRHIVRR